MIKSADINKTALICVIVIISIVVSVALMGCGKEESQPIQANADESITPLEPALESPAADEEAVSAPVEAENAPSEQADENLSAEPDSPIDVEEPDAAPEEKRIYFPDETQNQTNTYGSE